MPTKRITANLPASLLEEALAATGQGITETLVAGLEAVVKKQALAQLKKIQGKVHIVADKGRKHAGD